MHDWRNFNNISLESIMVILYDKGRTTVIHPGTWSQHAFVSGSVFLGRFIYLRRTFVCYLATCTSDTERSMINATTRERRFEMRLHTRFDSVYWDVFLLFWKGDKRSNNDCCYNHLYSHVKNDGIHNSLGCFFLVAKNTRHNNTSQLQYRIEIKTSYNDTCLNIALQLNIKWEIDLQGLAYG